MGGEENWDVKPAQIYSTLARLQESGHIVEETDGADVEGVDRRVYAITETSTKTSGKDTLNFTNVSDGVIIHLDQTALPSSIAG